MHSRRLAKRSVLGSRVCAPSVAGDGVLLPGVVQAVKQENNDVSTGLRRNVYTVLMQDGSLMEYSEDEIIICPAQMTGKGPMKSNFKQNSCNSRRIPCLALPMETQNEEADSHIAGPVEDLSGSGTKCALDMEEEHTQSVFLPEQKNEEVSSNIDIPHVRKSEDEVDMDKVTAAMVLTSLSTSPLIQNLPVKLSENGSWKEGGITPSSHSSSGFWSWSAPSDQSNPCTPSPPLSADSSKPFRMPSGPVPADDIIDEPDGSSLLLDEPIPRKRKNSMKVMFKCLWKNCGKVLSSAAGIQKHIRTTHLRRNCDSECSDGEEDFYYTEIKLNTDSMAEGSNGPCPVEHAPSLSQPPAPEPGCPGGSAKSEDRLITPLSRSAPSALYLVHTDHAYQATAPITIYSSTNLTPNRSTSLSISWQSPPVTFTGRSASPTDSCVEQRPAACTILASPPRATSSLRKSRGEGKKCRKVYGMENRDMWCTACRWKKACQRFVD